MELNGFGILPEDLMTWLVFMSDLKTASSILVSCKYWYNKYKHIINHDTITIFNNDRNSVEFPKITTIKNGRVIRYGDEIFWRVKSASACKTTIGHVDTVGELAQFNRQFDLLLKEKLSPSYEPPSPSVKYDGFWMQIQNSSRTEYFASSESNGVTYMHDYTAKRIIKLIEDLDIVNKDVRSDEERIIVEMFERNPSYLRDTLYSHKFQINKRGDTLIESSSGGCGHEAIFIKTSADLYNDLKEIIVHDKHKSSRKEMATFNGSSYSTRRVFIASLNLKNEEYWIVEYEELKEDSSTEMITKTLGRRPDVVKKFAKLLEIGIYGAKNIQNPHFNHKEIRRLPPPQSVMYNIAKRIPYCIDMHGLPRTYYIQVSLKRRQTENLIHIAAHNTGIAPIEEVLTLFHFVETHLDPVTNHKTSSSHVQTKNPSYRVGVTPNGSKPLFMQIEIESFSIFKTVTSASKEVVQKIWSFIEKYHSNNIPE